MKGFFKTSSFRVLLIAVVVLASIITALCLWADRSLKREYALNGVQA